MQCCESIRQKTGKSHLCALMSHIRALSPNSVTLKCAIHYLPKESEFERPKNKWNILGIICPKFFWSYIFIFLCSFSWSFQIASLSASHACCFKIPKFFLFEKGNPLFLLSLAFQAMTGKVLHLKFSRRQLIQIDCKYTLSKIENLKRIRNPFRLQKYFDPIIIDFCTRMCMLCVQCACMLYIIWNEMRISKEETHVF